MNRVYISLPLPLPLDRIDSVIETSLGHLGDFVGADRAYLFDYDVERRIVINTHEWCAQGIEPQTDTLQAVPTGMLADWVATHRAGGTVYVPDVLSLAPERSVRRVLEPQGVKSAIAAPMNAVIGLCQILLGSDLNDEQRDYLGKIHGSSRLLLGSINDILDYSKIEAGKLELEPRPFHGPTPRANGHTLRFGGRGEGPRACLPRLPRGPSGAARRCAVPRPGLDQPARQCAEVHRTGDRRGSDHPTRRGYR